MIFAIFYSLSVFSFAAIVEKPHGTRLGFGSTEAPGRAALEARPGHTGHQRSSQDRLRSGQPRALPWRDYLLLKYFFSLQLKKKKKVSGAQTRRLPRNLRASASSRTPTCKEKPGACKAAPGALETSVSGVGVRNVTQPSLCPPIRITRQRGYHFFFKKNLTFKEKLTKKKKKSKKAKKKVSILECSPSTTPTVAQTSAAAQVGPPRWAGGVTGPGNKVKFTARSVSGN